MARAGLVTKLGIATFAVVFASVVPSTATAMHVELGEAFSGAIGAPGEAVQADFNAPEGTAVRITARAASGDLRPTIVVRNAAGMTVAQDTGLSLGWLPRPNALCTFTVPASGNYVAEVGGASGSGAFSARLTGGLPAGTQLVSLAGRITDASGAGIPGAVVSVGPYRLVADASGNYSGSLPAGDYSATFAAAEFLTASQSVELRAGTSGSMNVTLAPLSPVKLTTGVSGDATPGADVTASVTVTPLDGSTVQSIAWSQIHGAPAGLAGADSATATVSLPSMPAFKDELLQILAEPPITAEQLPPNVPLPEGEFPGGLQNRFEVVGINPFALERAGAVALEVEVTTTSGTYTREVEVHAALPWKVAPGLRSVPIAAPVLLHGKQQATYDWALTPAPGSGATLADAATGAPYFTPDVPGLYVIEVTDESDLSVVTLEIHAGTWQGVIVGQDFAGRPVPDPACMTCHSTFAPDKFTPWAQTGHAEIFTNNLDTSTHYGSNCFPCHTVGYDPGAANHGFEEASDYGSFLAAGLINSPGDNWDRVVDEFPETARMANIQCENCHGPQAAAPGEDGSSHGWNAPDGEPRVGISSDVCATCHGEPLRHARFQQWQLSGHANYELAIDESGSGNCSRCHTGNGFLEWLPILLDDDPETDPLDSITVRWTEDETHPQTCATCHDPHAIGTTSGSNTNATVRISGDTPPLIGGFTATDVGRGAICMTCHNSRRGLRNDATFDQYFGTAEAARAAHGSAQTDVLMGQNAYLVPVGNRRPHSMIEDTCVKCHMESTPPPDLLAYNLGGSNHTFFASKEICSNCHEGLRAETVQSAVERFLDELEQLVVEGIVEVMADRIALGDSIDVNGTPITSTAQIEEIVFGETRGRQAIGVTLTGGTVVGLTRLTDVDVVDAGSTVIGQLYDFADPALIKAGWNWTLFHNDGSGGVHNPLFAFQALIAARDALSGAPPADAAAAAEKTLRRIGEREIRTDRTQRHDLRRSSR